MTAIEVVKALSREELESAFTQREAQLAREIEEYKKVRRAFEASEHERDQLIRDNAALVRERDTAHNHAIENAKERDQARAELAKFHEAMERERKPDWTSEHAEELRYLASALDYRANYHGPWNGIVMGEPLLQAARHLRYMATSFTLEANLVPAELKIKQLEADNAALRADKDKAYAMCAHMDKLLITADVDFEDDEIGKGWRSPQDFAKVEKQCAAMREALEHYAPYHQGSPRIDKALSTTAGRDYFKVSDALPIIDTALNYFYPNRRDDGEKSCAARNALFELRDRLLQSCTKCGYEAKP